MKDRDRRFIREIIKNGDLDALLAAVESKSMRVHVGHPRFFAEADEQEIEQITVDEEGDEVKSSTETVPGHDGTSFATGLACRIAFPAIARAVMEVASLTQEGVKQKRVAA